MQHPVRISSSGFGNQTEIVVCSKDLYQTVEMSASERYREGFRGETENKIISYSKHEPATTTSLQYLPSVVAIRCEAWGYSTRIFNLNSACCLILTTFTNFLDKIFKVIFLNSAIFFQSTVISPSMDPSMSLQPTSMMAPLTQQMSHLSLGSTGTVRESSLMQCKKKRTEETLSRLWTYQDIIYIFLPSFCSSWLLAHLCKEHTSHNMHTCRHQLFL